jgi:hypothetical protein
VISPGRFFFFSIQNSIAARCDPINLLSIYNPLFGTPGIVSGLFTGC